MHILSFLVIFRYIQAKSDGIRHIQELFRQVQAYSEPRYIQNPGIFPLRDIFRNPVHLETLHMQNFSIFKTQRCPESEVFSEPWYIQNSSIFRTRDILREKLGVSKLLFIFLGSFFVFVSFRIFVY